MSEAPLLETKGLSLRFEGRDRAALEDVSLRWEETEVLALVGGSGSGKSSLVRILIGAQSPTAGEVFFRGSRLLGPRGEDSARRRSFRAAIQPLFQDPGGSLDPRMTLYEAIAEGPRLRGERDEARLTERVRAGLEELDLDCELASKFPHELSGGERQRGALARVLAVNPAGLVLDEPTSALDAVRQARLLDCLRTARKRRGMAVLLVSHDLDLVRNLADRVAVLHEGRLVECSAARDLYANPRHPYTRALLASARTAASEEEENRP